MTDFNKLVRCQILCSKAEEMHDDGLIFLDEYYHLARHFLQKCRDGIPPPECETGKGGSM